MQNFAQYFRAIQTLFFGLLSGQVMVCAVLWFVQNEQTAAPGFQEDRWLQFTITFSLFLLGVSYFVRKNLIEKARPQETLIAKLRQYRQAILVGWALIEGATLLNAVFFFLSGKIEFLYIAGALIALFITQIPTKPKLINELDLNTTDQSVLDDPNAEVVDAPIHKD
jgi:hypothetical protein